MDSLFKFGIYFCTAFGTLMLFVGIYALTQKDMPAAGSFFFSVTAFATAIYYYRLSKKKPNQPPVPTRGNGT